MWLTLAWWMVLGLTWWCGFCVISLLCTVNVWKRDDRQNSGLSRKAFRSFKNSQTEDAKNWTSWPAPFFRWASIFWPVRSTDACQHQGLSASEMPALGVLVSAGKRPRGWSTLVTPPSRGRHVSRCEGKRDRRARSFLVPCAHLLFAGLGFDLLFHFTDIYSWKECEFVEVFYLLGCFLS